MAAIVLPSLLVAQQRDSIENISIIDSTSLVPTTTIVPILDAPHDVEINSTIHEVTPSMRAVQRREVQRGNFAARVDSLIYSKNYSIYPYSFKEMPSGHSRRIYADFYYVAVEDSAIVVHLPLEHTAIKSIETINFDTLPIQNYQALRTNSGWQINLNVTYNNKEYTFCIEVSSLTGEVVMTMSKENSTVRYNASFTPPKE